MCAGGRTHGGEAFPETTRWGTDVQASLHRYALAVLICSLPFWWLGQNAQVELPAQLPISALMVVVPGLVAICIAVRSGGLSGALALVRTFRPRLRPRTGAWWAVACLTMPAVFGVVWSLQTLEGVPVWDVSVGTAWRLALALLVFLVAAAIEELGWTAYATALARDRGLVPRAGLVLGGYWAAWHVIPWFQAGHSISWVVAQSAFTVMLRVLMVVVYRKACQQAATAIPLHATANLGLVPGDGTLYDPMLTTAVLAPAILLMLGVAEPLRSSEGRGRVVRPIVLISAFLLAAPLGAQETRTPRRGWEFAGIPAVNYDADEGFGYGAVLEAYDYGAGVVKPYHTSLQPALFFTTAGRRDVTLFVDAPGLLARGWRLGGFAGLERHLTTPYYGRGNATEYDPTRENGASPHYYRFGRKRWRANVTLQKALGETPVRLLVGVGVENTSVETLPDGGSTTLISEELGGVEAPGGWLNHLRVGVIWDTRDRESGPRRGSWSEFLFQRVATALGSFAEYTRWTIADRRYFPLGLRLTLANRLILQGASGSVPFFDLSVVQSSFKVQEGLGGVSSIRGLLRNRFVGKGTLIWNLELRWRASDFGVLGRPSHLVATGFLDSGRVWREGVRLSELAHDLHHGWGGGLRLGIGRDFVVALDIGTSAEAPASTYLGLGYLF